MSETYFKPIINDINELDKNPLSKSTENDERTGAMTPGAITNIKDILSKKPHGRMDWTDFCSDSDSDDEDESEETEQKSESNDKSEETEQKSESNDKSEETAFKQLKENYKSISSFLNELKKLEIDEDFYIKITILFLNLSGFKFQIVEFKDFILKKFFESKNIDINSLNKGGKNSIIKGNNLHYVNEILDLIKSAIPFPSKLDVVIKLINFIDNITEDDELYRHSVKKSFDIENKRILLMTLGKEIPRNPIKRNKNNEPVLNEKGQKIPLEIVKIVKLADIGINIAIENSEGPDAFPYTKEFNKLKEILNSVKNDTNLAIIASIYYQIKDDLEKIVEKVNLEYSENK